MNKNDLIIKIDHIVRNICIYYILLNDKVKFLSPPPIFRYLIIRRYLRNPDTET